MPWRRKWQPTSVRLPGEFQGQRSLAGWSPWGHKESDRTERLTLSRGWSKCHLKVKVKIPHSCLTVCNRIDYTVHEIPQARILKWVAFAFSRGSSQPTFLGRCSLCLYNLTMKSWWVFSWQRKWVSGRWNSHPFCGQLGHICQEL